MSKLNYDNNICFIHFRHIDGHQEDYIAVLRDAVAIKSVSAWADSWGEINKMVNWTKKKLEKLGATCELKDIGMQVK